MNTIDSMPWWQTVLHFWFVEAGAATWFVKDAAFDQRICGSFAELHGQLSRAELEVPATAQGHLAAIVVLDQFSRNMYRGTPRAFAADTQALALAQRTIANGLDRELDIQQRHFIYLPFEHSEDFSMQRRSVELITRLDDPNLSDYAWQHYDIILRFGRFPHRNAILGRPSTADELEFLRGHPGF